MMFLLGFGAGICFSGIAIIAVISYIGGEYNKADARMRGLL